MFHFTLSSWALGLIFFFFSAQGLPQEHSLRCPSTPPDALGPFYKPDAPVRSSIGQGYVLKGVVKSSKDCSPFEGARIEFWLAADDGRYDDDHRATVLTEKSGAYQLESDSPSSYGFRRPHIHIRGSARGFNSLVTQHYPEKGKTQGLLDPVLIPSR